MFVCMYVCTYVYVHVCVYSIKFYMHVYRTQRPMDPDEGSKVFFYSWVKKIHIRRDSLIIHNNDLEVMLRQVITNYKEFPIFKRK